MIERPLMVYVVTERSLGTTDDNSKVPKHEANYACFYCVCIYDHTQHIMWSHVGEDCITK